MVTWARAARAGAAGAVLVLSVVTAPTPGRAQETRSFEGVASGGLIQTLIRVEPAVVQSDLVDPGTVVAQARLTSLGDSTAYASHPYPGTVPLALPGLISSLVLQGAASVPGYPFVAESAFPARPEATVGIGSLRLSATSRADTTSGEATDGANRTLASVTLEEGSGQVTSQAETELGSFDLGPAVSIAGMRSAATAKRAPGAEVERQTEFSVDRMSILGQQVRVTAEGLHVADETVVPGVSGPVRTVNELLAALAEQGTTITVLPPVEDKDGATSAGLEISQRVNVGLEGASVVTVTYIVGRSSAWVSDQAPGSAIPGLLPEVTTEFGAPVPTETASGPGLTPPLGDGPVASGAVSAVLPDSVAASRGAPGGTEGSAAVATGPASGGGSSVSPAVATVRRLVPERSRAGVVYPVLVLGGVSLVAATSLLRKWGVKSAWSS